MRRTYTVCFILLTAMGCGKQDRPPVFPVSGQVTWEGAPVTGATIVFHPGGNRDPKSIRSHAVVGSDGNYRLTTYASQDGAPTGEYAVTIFWPGKRDAGVPDDGTDSGIPDQLKGAYRDPLATKIRATVRESETIIDFKLP